VLVLALRLPTPAKLLLLHAHRAGTGCDEVLAALPRGAQWPGVPAGQGCRELPHRRVTAHRHVRDLRLPLYVDAGQVQSGADSRQHAFQRLGWGYGGVCRAYRQPPGPRCAVRVQLGKRSLNASSRRASCGLSMVNRLISSSILHTSSTPRHPLSPTPAASVAANAFIQSPAGATETSMERAPAHAFVTVSAPLIGAPPELRSP